MKVYLEEKDMPKDCVNCDFGYANNFCEIDYELDLRKFNKNQKHPKCPLQTIDDYTKKVRKEVCDELFNMLSKRAELIDFGYNVSEFMFSIDDLQECSKEILDRIQGENN